MTEEHRELAMNIKNIHKELRTLSALIGYEEAWKHHMKDEKTRQLYAESMKQLAEKHWKNNSSSEGEMNLKCLENRTVSSARDYSLKARNL